MFRFDDAHRLVAVELHRNLQEFLPLAAVDREHPVAGDPAERLAEIVVQPIDAVLVLGGFGHQAAVGHADEPQPLAHGGVVGNLFGNDVLGALQRVLRRPHPFFRIDVGRREGERVGTGTLLCVNRIGERLKTAFLRHRGAGAALGTVGAVDVVDFGHGGRRVERRRKLRGHRPLLLNGGAHLLPLLVEAAQVFEPFVQLTQHLVVERAGHLLAVAGDKRDGVAVVDEFDGVFHLLRAQVEFGGQGSENIHTVRFLSSGKTFLG